MNGLQTHTYTVKYTNGVQTSRSQAVDVVTTPAINAVIATGTKVPAPVVSTPTAAPGCTPLTNFGNFYEPGNIAGLPIMVLQEQRVTMRRLHNTYNNDWRWES